MGAEELAGAVGGQWTEASHFALYPDNLNLGLARFVAEVLAPADFLEIGAGLGSLANAISTMVNLKPSYCIEPQIIAPLHADRGLRQLNFDILSQPAPNVLNRKFDLVMSIEVAEHIPLEGHPALFDFLAARAGAYVLFSGARPGQGGHGHIAERPEDEWRSEFTRREFSFDDRLTVRARNACDQKNINHRRNVMVFRAPDIYAELDRLEARAKPYLADLLRIILQRSPQFLDGNLFFVNLQGALGGMPEDSLRPKRHNLMVKAANASKILEIGFNGGHSALLMLLANPTSKLTIVDLLEAPIARPCFELLDSVFPGRLSLVAGDSRDVLAGLAPAAFDIVHIDGGKHGTIGDDLTLTRALVTDDHVVFVDDTQNDRLRAILDERVAGGELAYAAFAKENRLGASRRWTHRLARFEREETFVDSILARVREIYADTTFPSIYVAAQPSTAVPGEPRARSLAMIMRDVEDRGLTGAFVEIGVAAGHSSVIAALATSKYVPRDFFLYDTFEGFLELPDERDLNGQSIRDYDLSRYAGQDCSIDVVRRRILSAGVVPARLFMIKGDAETTVRRIDPGPIVVLRLDVDLFVPTLASLEAFYDRLVAGGWLIVDDYGHWRGCKAAVDRFFQQRGLTLESMPVDYTCHVLRKPV